jgi:LysM repeat protein
MPERLTNVASDFQLMKAQTLRNTSNAGPVLHKETFRGAPAVIVTLKNNGVALQVTIEEGLEKVAEHLAPGASLTLRYEALAEKPFPWNFTFTLDTLGGGDGALNARLEIFQIKRAAEAAIVATTGFAQPKGRVHVVKPGDSLWKIAQQLLGDGNKWPKIYDANKAAIGANPDLIRPGLRLTIP